MDTTKVAVGALLLVVSSAILFGLGVAGGTLPVLIGAVAALGMAAGALLVGTSHERRPV